MCDVNNVEESNSLPNVGTFFLSGRRLGHRLGSGKIPVTTLRDALIVMSTSTLYLIFVAFHEHVLL